MKTKLGRPEMPEGKANTEIINLRVSGEILKEVDGAAKQSKQKKPEWMRNALRKEARNSPVWVKSKWKSKELDGKTVEFKLTAPNYWVEGLGLFRVLENPKGELKIDIVVSRYETPDKITDHIYHLYQPTADKIEVNPDPKKSDFRVSA